MSEIDPIYLNKKQNDSVLEIMGKNRAYRRKLGKQIGATIPGTTKPYVKYIKAD